MKASFLSVGTYRDPTPLLAGWPAPPGLFDPATGQKTMELKLEQVAKADELGFDWVSFSEHHYQPFILEPNPLMMAAAASQVVKRAKLAVLGPIVTFNNPIRIAEEIAMVDSLSGGRVIVLFLRSGGFEYASYTSNLAESRERTQEACILIERALSEPQPFGWEGKYYSYRTVSVWPQMVQESPLFLSSGNSFESAEFAARRGHGLACSFSPPAFLGQVVERYNAEARRAGWEPTRDRIVYRGFCALAENASEAQAAADAMEGMSFGEGSNPIGPAFGALQFVGDPAMVVEQIREIYDLGFGVVDIAFAGGLFDHDAVMRNLELFAAEVLPALHEFDAVDAKETSHAG